MDVKDVKTLDFSNNFSGIPNTPPVSAIAQGRPLFSIGVNTPQTLTVVQSNGSSGHGGSSTNLQDVGGAHLTLEKKTGMKRSVSSPTLSQFCSIVPGSKVISNVNIQVNVPGYTTDKSVTSDDSSSVDRQVHSGRPGSAGPVATPQTKHVRKQMQTLYSSGEVNKYGSLFRKPGTDYKAPPTKTTEYVPPKAPLLPFKEEEGNTTPTVFLGHTFKKWITTSPVKQTDRERNAFSPTSF